MKEMKWWKLLDICIQKKAFVKPLLASETFDNQEEKSTEEHLVWQQESQSP